MTRSRTWTPWLGVLLIAAPLSVAAPAPKKDRQRSAAKEEAAAAATDTRLQALERKLADLERRVRNLEARQARKPAAPARDPQKEQQARQLYQEADRAIQQGDTDRARELVQQLDQQFRGTAAQRQAARLSQMLAVIGKPIPEKLGIDKWFQGRDLVRWPPDGTALLVFWEQWCPHCRREVPKIEQTWQQFKDRGLEVLALTKITRSATEEKVRQFIADNQLTYPIAKEDGSMSRAFNVSSIPAAAVVKDGKIVWRGHPARLTTAMLERWLGSED